VSRAVTAALPLALALIVLARPPRPAIAAPIDAAPRIVEALLDAGFESVAARAAGDTIAVLYENRVLRYEMRALGEAARRSAELLDSSAVLALVPETRGVPIAAVVARAGDWLRFLRGEESAAWFRARVVVRSGSALPPTPAADRRLDRSRSKSNPSRWKLDLAARPLLDLQFGLAQDPFQVGFWVAPEATLSPLRGTLLTVQGKLRVEDELDASSPDVALGRTTLSGAAWLRGEWLGAASGGYFADDRYGVAAEVGRLVRDGALELRAGGDLTGLLEFTRDVTLYSGMETWSAFAAVSHRTCGILDGLNLATTLTAGRFQRGDAGGRLDVVRRFGETEVGFFGIKTDEGSLGGFRVNVPLPLDRVGRPARVRLVTVPSFPWEYRETLEPAGLRVRLFDNLDRFRKGLYPTVIRNDLDALRDGARRDARGFAPAAPAGAGGDASLAGTTGLFNVPSAEITPDGAFRLGVNVIDRKWSTIGRGYRDNTVYFFTAGFLPAMEVSIRATVFPEQGLLGDREIAAADRMASARICIVSEQRDDGAATPRPASRGVFAWRGPALAIGIDDAKGNRRAHSLYLVGTKTLTAPSRPLGLRLSGGFGSRAIDATAYVLDGPFGGLECQFHGVVTFLIENDSEKWNTGARVIAFSRLTAQGVFLDLNVFSGGVSWTQRF